MFIMKAVDFKKAVSELKGSLKGKTLKISFVSGENIELLSFDNLRGFGNAILELEKKGAGFNFIKVGNRFTQKRINKPSQASEVLSRGVWNEVFFLATTVKI